MAYRDFQHFLEVLESKGELKRISEPISPYLEITEVTDRVVKKAGPALLFENVVGPTHRTSSPNPLSAVMRNPSIDPQSRPTDTRKYDFPVAINTRATRKRMSMALSCDDFEEHTQRNEDRTQREYREEAGPEGGSDHRRRRRCEVADHRDRRREDPTYPDVVPAGPRHARGEEGHHDQHGDIEDYRDQRRNDRVRSRERRQRPQDPDRQSRAHGCREHGVEDRRVERRGLSNQPGTLANEQLAAALTVRIRSQDRPSSVANPTSRLERLTAQARRLDSRTQSHIVRQWLLCVSRSQRVG